MAKRGKGGLTPSSPPPLYPTPSSPQGHLQIPAKFYRREEIREMAKIISGRVFLASSSPSLTSPCVVFRNTQCVCTTQLAGATSEPHCSTGPCRKGTAASYRVSNVTLHSVASRSRFRPRQEAVSWYLGEEVLIIKELIDFWLIKCDAVAKCKNFLRSAEGATESTG